MAFEPMKASHRAYTKPLTNHRLRCKHIQPITSVIFPWRRPKFRGRRLFDVTGQIRYWRREVLPWTATFSAKV